jgi:site-specific DNA recombinase
MARGDNNTRGGARVAAYARFSSELQNPTSIEDQLRNCRAAAEKNGWTVLEEFIRSDSAVTGRSMEGRDGLKDLIRLAKTTPKPFDGILIDDTSRFGRYLPDVLRECDTLAQNGIFLHFASDRIDSRDGSFRMFHAIKGLMDEEYVKGLREKVHRGQSGRVLNGYNPGGKCYGYVNKPIEDTSRKALYGRYAVKGVIQEIIPEEAQIVSRIFEMYAAGASYATIAKALNFEGVLSPQPPRRGKVRAWCPSAIREMLLNERYRGVRVWNRTESIFNPVDAKTRQRPRPRCEWITHAAPELRIVSDELWERVREQNRRVREKHGPQHLGGMNRTQNSLKYLFSGLMVCGLCGANITIIGGKAPNSRYGCPNHRFRGMCENNVTIPQRKLEQQLIGALCQNFSDQAFKQELLASFKQCLAEAVDREVKFEQEAGTKNAELKLERANLIKQIYNLTDAIAQLGISPALSARLSAAEARLQQIEHLLTSPQKYLAVTFTSAEIEGFLDQNCKSLTSVLLGDAAPARSYRRESLNSCSHLRKCRQDQCLKSMAMWRCSRERTM